MSRTPARFPSWDPDRRHMDYLNRLIAQPRSRKAVLLDPSKRFDWLKFCHRCGRNISQLPKHVRKCTGCAPERIA